ncbi:receptor-type tyrosine-protein phosphatase epsilon-like [Littorina saxatilis]|uniref:protein-tyrosine-phosphatase n=1 Tax=Littorina saxatilis TaxID=31220 RepID=A0AAN9B8U8_9CAEN
MSSDSTSENPCDPGFYGKDCINPCPVNCPLACNSIGFCDQCTPGYEGFKCEDVCTAGTFGMGCKDTCSYHCETLECHHITGACSCKSGFKLDQCIESCDMTTWGQNCTQTCSTGCNQQDCDAITGVCQHGCGPGFLGEFCDLECRRGKFGRDCAEVCSAKCTDSVCNHVNGDCISCLPGFQGKACDTPCGAGRWGTQCSKSCSENCGGDDMACSPTDGVCSTGCVDGWRGPLCTQECLPGNFGSNCTLNCSQNCLPPAAGNSPCHHVTGQCPQGCNAGFAGAACLTQAAPSAAMLGGVLAGVAVAIIVIVIVIAFVVFRRRKRSPKSLIDDTTEENGNVRLSSAFVNINPGFVGNGKDNGFDDEDEASDLGISMATESEVERDKPVQQNGTPDTTNTRFASRELATKLEGWRSDWGELYEQFTELPKGLIHTTSVALNLSNKRKNRYKNICAYDDSRVKLNIMDSDPNSDYINASYVDGYDGKPKFIASQGAHDVMVNDFLRMLWEKHVTTVVMLTNTHEGGKHKCEQYWPDSGEKKYGTVVVTLLSTIYTADYVIRTLQVAKEGRKIQVSQFHFTSWPDKGVPFSPWPLVDFHMMVKTHTATQPHDTPIVVHCSAGIGRTGTYIALDNLLCESAATQSLDFNTCVWNLRQARVNMIQTLEQYYFLHEAVLVGQAVAGSLHKKDTLADHVLDLGRPTAEGYTKMAAEYKRLGACRCRYDEDDYQAGRQEENISKNRDYNILPRDSHRPILTSTVAGTNDYINAVFLPGYRKRQHFLVTQMPLAITVLDLWRLVGEHTVSTIVTFPSNPTTVGDSAPEFLPEEGQTCQFGPYKVTGRSYTSQNRYREGFLYMVKSRRLSLGRHGRGLHVLRCEESNPDPDLMLSLAQAAIFGVPEKQLEDSIILVVCRTGAEMSGVFAAVAQLIHRLGESPVSVPTVVGNLRAIRPQLISSLEQYNTIYEAVKQFAINSSIYTNLAITMPSKPPRKDRGSSKNKKKENNADQQTERRNSKKDKKAEKDKTKVNGRANGSANGEMVEQPEDDDKDGNRDGGNNQLPKASSNENDAVTVGGTNTVNFSL